MLKTLVLRRYHRWLALFAGIQVCIWLLSGTYMVLMDIDFIRGNSLTLTQTSNALTPVAFPLTQLQQQYPDATQILLSQGQEQAFYQFNSHSQLITLNAQTGLPLSLLTEKQAKKIASSIYTGKADIEAAILFEQHAPNEINPKLLPVWQINFADAIKSSLYISAYSGAIVTKRHHYWRLFDFMWMLHIMDYDTRDNIHNNLLTIMTCLSLTTVISGLFLLRFRLRRTKRVAK